MGSRERHFPFYWQRCAFAVLCSIAFAVSGCNKKKLVTKRGQAQTTTDSATVSSSSGGGVGQDGITAEVPAGAYERDFAIKVDKVVKTLASTNGLSAIGELFAVLVSEVSGATIRDLVKPIELTISAPLSGANPNASDIYVRVFDPITLALKGILRPISVKFGNDLVEVVVNIAGDVNGLYQIAISSASGQLPESLWQVEARVKNLRITAVSKNSAVASWEPSDSGVVIAEYRLVLMTQASRQIISSSVSAEKICIDYGFAYSKSNNSIQLSNLTAATSYYFAVCSAKSATTTSTVSLATISTFTTTQSVSVTPTTTSTTVPTATPTSVPATLQGVSSYGVGNANCAIMANKSLWCWGAGGNGQLGNGGAVNSGTPVQEATASLWNSLSVGYAGLSDCAIKTNGTLWCWGYNSSGQLGDGTTTGRTVPTAVGSSTDWSSVFVGYLTTCALKTDHTMWCWGENSSGQVGDGTTTNRTTPTQVGSFTDWSNVQVSLNGTVCAMRSDNSLWCWGYNANGQVGDGSTTNRSSPVQIGSTNWTDFFLGSTHACAIKNTGTGWCWGNGNAGEIGDTFSSLNNVNPTGFGIASWRTFSLGETQTCGIKTDNTLWCAGSNYYGELGSGNTSQINTAAQVGSDSDWDTVSVLNDHTCATKTNHTLWCWGHNFWGQLGDNSTTPHFTPNQVGSGTSWASVKVGKTHTCAAKTDQSLWCFGDNFYGQRTGTPEVNLQPSPVQVAGSTWSSISVALGGSLACGLKTDGTAWCWGGNYQGALGLGTRSNASSPTQIGVATTWTSISASFTNYKTLGVQSSGNAYYWGQTTLSPALLASSSTVSQAKAGYAFNCLIQTDHTLWCWGDINNYGQLGDGTNSGGYAFPNQSGSANDWNILTVGYSHSCAIKQGGSLWCWGYNGQGQLGIGSTTDAYSPTQVGTDINWTAIKAGYYTTCGIKSDQTLWCWGDNSGGQLANGTTALSTSPLQILTASDWSDVDVGNSNICAVKVGGTLWCWGGSNSFGELGYGNFTGSSVPLQVGSATNWSSVDVGYGQSCARRADNTLWCWGASSFGQLGVGVLWSTSLFEAINPL